MQLKGPYIYAVYVNSKNNYSIVGPGGIKNFVAPVSTRGPKIYAFSDNRKLIYIGQTVQGMSARMRLGIKENGTSGYWGYQWRKELKKATLHVWCLEGHTANGCLVWQDTETVKFGPAGAMKILVAFSVVGSYNLLFVERLIDTVLSGVAVQLGYHPHGRCGRCGSAGGTYFTPLPCR